MRFLGMAPFLRESLHRLTWLHRAQRELYLLKLSETKYVRWYSETATLKDATPAAFDAAGESGTSSAGCDSVKGLDDASSIKETSASLGLKPDDGPKGSPSDRLTNLILTRMRAKNNSSDTLPSPISPGSSKTVKPADRSSELGQGDKWDQVMQSMRNMAAKRREQMAKAADAKSSLLKRLDSEDQDDFSDLDHPSGQLNKFHSSTDEAFPSTDEAFRSHPKSSNKRENGWQFLNMPKEPKESQAVSFGFLKALENDSSTARSQSTKSASDGNMGSMSNGKSKGSGFQSPSKETKPLSFEFLKPSDGKVESLNPSKVSSPLGVQPNDVARPSFLTQISQKRESSSLPGAVGARARQLSHEDVKDETNSTLPGHRSGHMVSVHNLSAQSNLALIKEALLIHGEILTSFKKPNVDGSYTAFVEFKTAEAMEDALATKWLQIDSKSFSITRADPPITTVVRLNRVNAIADSQVLAICEKFGQVDHFRKRGGSVYDVYYKAGELTNMSAILDRLNEVTLYQRRWAAFPAPLLHPGARKEVLKSSEGQTWHLQQMNQILSRLEMGLEAMSVYFEDLKALVNMEDELTK